MGSLILISVLFGALWGAIWGILDGTFIKRGWLVGQGPQDFFAGLLRSFVTGGIGYFVAILVFGPGGATFFAIVVALILKWTLEGRFRT